MNYTWQGPSQELETGCPNWVIVNLCAILEEDGSQLYTLLAVINLKVFTYCDNALTDWPFNKLFKGKAYLMCYLLLD